MSDAEVQQFKELQKKLPIVWQRYQEDSCYEHTSVIVPSMTVNQEELAKVTGAAFYEERLMFALIRLRNPNARLIYVTSQPVHRMLWITICNCSTVFRPAMHANACTWYPCSIQACGRCPKKSWNART